MANNFQAFIFDMDGVMIDSERTWDEKEPEFYHRVFGSTVAEKILGKTMGLDVGSIYRLAVSAGYQKSDAEFLAGSDALALEVYGESPLTDGLTEFIDYLTHQNYRIGLVSASLPHWIEPVLNRTQRRSAFQVVQSVGNHPTLKPKPAPDGYQKTMAELGVNPAQTIILEDSQTGLRSARASQAGLVICLTEHHHPGYHPEGADVYLPDLAGVKRYLDELK